MSDIEEEIMSALEPAVKLDEKVKAAAEDQEPENIEKLRKELISLSKSGDIEKPVSYLKKANKKVIKKLHATIQTKKLEKTNEIMAEMLVTKWATALGWIGIVKNPEALGA